MNVPQENPYSRNIAKLKWYGFFGGLWFFLPVLFIYFKNAGLSYAEFGLIFSATNIAKFIFEVPSGTFADRIGRKNSLAIASFLMAVTFLCWGFGENFLFFLIGGFVKGVAQSFGSGSDTAIMYDSLKYANEEERFSKHYGKKWGYANFALAFGSLASIFMIPMGYKWLFAISSMTMMVSFFIALSLKEPPYEKEKQEEKVYGHLKEACVFLLKHKSLKWFFLGSVVLIFSIQIFFQYLQFFLKDLNINEQNFGYFYAFFTVVSGLAASKAYRIKEKMGEVPSLWLMLLSLVLAYIVSGISHVFLLVLLMMLFVQVNYGLTTTLLNSYLQRHVDSHHRSTIQSLRQFVYGIVMTVCAPLLGLVADHYDFRTMVVVLGVFVFVVAGVSFLRVSKLWGEEDLEK